MGKKQYITPKIIDLSIEAITGVGAGNCDTGTDFHTSSCAPQGVGASSACNLGYGASASCAGGALPQQSGVYCDDGNGAGTICATGGSARSANGRCKSGSAATGLCESNGGSPAPGNFCLSGPDHANCSSGGNQVPHGSS